MDDIFVAFDKLDEIDKLPEIFCEAIDLVCWYWNLSSHSVKIEVNDNEVKSQVATTMMESSFLVEAMISGHITFTKAFSKFSAGSFFGAFIFTVAN